MRILVLFVVCITLSYNRGLSQAEIQNPNTAPTGPGIFWKTTGNANTIDGTHFIGTTDNVPFNIRVNNQRAGRIDLSSSVTFFGYWAGRDNSTGTHNVAVGTNAMLTNTSGNENTALGVNALRGAASATGNGNTAIGYNAMLNVSSGFQNVAVGHFALAGNTTGHYNVAVGAGALDQNTTGNRNVAVGFWAARSTSTGRGNIAVGNRALYSNITGIYNIAIGDSALHSCFNASENIAIGYAALTRLSSGVANIALGTFAGAPLTSGSYNTITGYGANASITTGLSNTSYGMYANFYHTTHSNNTSVGYAAGDNYTFENGTFVGHSAYPNASGYTNVAGFGYQARPTASNMIRIGNGAVTSINGAVNFTVVSDERFKKQVAEDVHGLDFIMKLRPVTYYYDVRAMDRFIEGGPRKDHDGNIKEYSAEELSSIASKEKIKYTGFIAQEVEKAAQELNYDFSGVDAPDNDRDPYGLRYSEFVVPLVKAVQEQQQQLLLQQKQIEDLQRQNAELMKFLKK